ncbi:hypothetical protein HanXRQr2_Chr03g0091551 [Helianthus annuus]|uniref:Uncharacterized protein n=1 Tax=Helianthus annuus TaxID=4232 RepID=A0A9K3NTR5_HELAN|nr:hypothetical protein HanXRQr2_Chr03g0091551 [Helianthus annuus]
MLIVVASYALKLSFSVFFYIFFFVLRSGPVHNAHRSIDLV